ncbi:PTS sugar transporter subunit IIC [Desulfocurvus sp. DL9XJH121]
MVGACATAAFWVVTAAALFTVFSLLRFSFNLGVVERPLVQGLVWGVLTGDLNFAVSVALIFELLWLDLIPAGTFIPPNAAASTLGVLALCAIFGFHGPADVIFPVLLTLPLAWFAARGEQVLRRWQDAGYNSLQEWLEEGDEGYRPGRLVRRAAAQAAAAYFLFFTAGLSVLSALVYWLLGLGFLHPPQDMFTWGHLWITASVGGLLALRVPGGYGVVFGGACVVAAASLFLG